ncbi:site-specific DNA-methyltransferase [Janibacter sp. Y6]|uniref:site-specific DNA-methyltransferase n=1 Tax=Janibacter sp. Y6 TaxID=2913552 RepID=UPI0034A35349
MSRLNDLLRRLESTDPALAKDLRQEYDALTDRRAFGLNFERHTPEVVELPGRKVRRGDKVHVLAGRGNTPTAQNSRLWRVVAIDRNGEAPTVSLEALEGNLTDATEALLEDVVVAAGFRDPIYPGLVSTGRVERGGDKPFHTVINAENYHALQALLFTHRGKVDCIYIDPPYNTGAKDWKYNNDYVESDDLYRHSKWLAFMERRLIMARGLLRPDRSSLIVTIDEKEYLRLGLLLEQIFPDARIQMITAVINPRDVTRQREFSRVNEYIFVVSFGVDGPTALELPPHWLTGGAERKTVRGKLHWASLSRTSENGHREHSPGCFYPVFVKADGSGIHSFGEALPKDHDRRRYDYAPPGTIPVWPIRSSGREGAWQLGPSKAREAFSNGYVRSGPVKNGRAALYYLKSGEQAKVERGEFRITGRGPDGSIITEPTELAVPRFVPGTVWSIPSHDAGVNGSNLLSRFVPDVKFPFPKSLYAVEDVLKFFVADKPEAVVVDFFSGSGTTAHALMRINHSDGGRRQSIAITNNEVSAETQRLFRIKGLRPGDTEWEEMGICEAVTKPRIRAAITGVVSNGEDVKGDYKYNEEFSMADGLGENAEFFTLTHEAPLPVASHRRFEKIAPLLWMRSGSAGRRIDDVTCGWDVTDRYGVLADLDQTDSFVKAVTAVSETICVAFIVTDEDRLFQTVVRELPPHVETIRLYEAYLRNFEIEAGRSSR